MQNKVETTPFINQLHFNQNRVVKVLTSKHLHIYTRLHNC